VTKPRTSIHRELFGIIGRLPRASEVQKRWNAYFREQGIDASMDIYPTPKKNLPERLSEMFHFDRRGYIVGKDLSKAITALLDIVEPEARRRGVAWVENRKGVLIGKKKIQEARGLLDP